MLELIDPLINFINEYYFINFKISDVLIKKNVYFEIRITGQTSGGQRPICHFTQVIGGDVLGF